MSLNWDFRKPAGVIYTPDHVCTVCADMKRRD